AASARTPKASSFIPRSSPSSRRSRASSLSQCHRFSKERGRPARFRLDMTRAMHKGWHGRGYLPQFDSPETTQFVTFRLADSLPRDVYRKLAAQTTNLEVLRSLAEDHLDEGRGQCWLAQSEIADIVRGALFHFDGERYRLCAWVIMPNHV